MTSLEHSTIKDQWQVFLFDINYGLGERIQLTVALPYLLVWEKGVKDRLGFDGVEFGFKYRFLDKSEFLNSDFSCNPKVYSPFKTEEGSEFILPLEWLSIVKTPSDIKPVKEGILSIFPAQPPPLSYCPTATQPTPETK
jgi:hypothetical protein